MELVGEFFDDGYTGTNYDRPGFRSVLEAVEGMVEAGTAEYLVIGNRPVGKNPFRLTGSSETWSTIFSRGELVKAALSITLEEYA